MSNIELDRNVATFATGDETASRRAFDCLFPHLQRDLMRRLYSRARDPVEREDFAAETLQRLLESPREKFRDRGYADVLRWCLRVAIHLIIDDHRKHSKITLQTLDTIENLDVPTQSLIVDVFVSLMANRAYWLANVLWLEMDPALSSEVHDRQRFVATRYFVDGEPLHDILASMPTPPPDEPPLSLELLKTWVHDRSVLYNLIFHTLYYDNERLVSHVLHVEEKLDHEKPTALDDLQARMASNPIGELEINGVIGPAVVIALWRYRFALTPAQILNKYKKILDDWQITEKDLTDICTHLAAREPFAERADHLKNAFLKRPSKHGAAPLKDDNAWRRLVFQYEYNDEIPLSDIAGRVQPAAAVGDFRLTEDMINSWTKGKQLVHQLLKRWHKTFGGDFDA